MRSQSTYCIKVRHEGEEKKKKQESGCDKKCVSRASGAAMAAPHRRRLPQGSQSELNALLIAFGVAHECTDDRCTTLWSFVREFGSAQEQAAAADEHEQHRAGAGWTGPLLHCCGRRRSPRPRAVDVEIRRGEVHQQPRRAARRRRRAARRRPAARGRKEGGTRAGCTPVHPNSQVARAAQSDMRRALLLRQLHPLAGAESLLFPTLAALLKQDGSSPCACRARSRRRSVINRLPAATRERGTPGQQGFMRGRAGFGAAPVQSAWPFARASGPPASASPSPRAASPADAAGRDGRSSAEPQAAPSRGRTSRAWAQ